ncbi:MAG: FAD-dependent oxidoreductase [Planctomycetes bacterium]|nr:FAD-dependent oxidoreductase [Planctomycetota bacterium]
MAGYELKSREIGLDESYDIIVAGGGPAGCTAAAAAAREGKKVLLLEASGALGGMGTGGLVPAWCPFSDKEKIIYSGLAEKVFTQCKEGMTHVSNGAMDWVAIDPELLKRIYDDLVIESGADVLFHSSICAVDKENNGISAVIVSNKAGLTAYMAKVFIDCTGDADLAAWAGAEFMKGDEESGDLQPATHCFILTNVDEYHYHNSENLHGGNKKSPMYAIVDSGKFPLIKDWHACNNIIGPRTVGFNSGHVWNVDNTDPKSLTEGLITGRKLAAQLHQAFIEFSPKAFASSFLVSTGSLLGIRETRRIIGDYFLTVEDYVARRSFKDEIGRNCYFIDVHGSAKEVELEKKGKFNWESRTRRYEPGESHGIPYGCLTPKGVRNVLVAGRAVSCDRPVQGSVRVMPVCLVMGEAAGVAAAAAADNAGCDVHTVDVQALRAKLKEYGGYLPDVE